MSEGGDARNHEAEIEAVAEALSAYFDTGQTILMEIASAAIDALDAVRRSPTAEDAVRLAYEDGFRAGRSPQGEDHEALP